MLVIVCWVMLAMRLVSCLAPPLCQPDTLCSLSSMLYSPTGEYLYTVSGVQVEVLVYGDKFSIKLSGSSVDLAHLPRYGSLQYYGEVHVLGAGRDVSAGPLLSALNLDTKRLVLSGWQGAALGDDLATALPGLLALELSGIQNVTLAELRWAELPALRQLFATDAVLVGPPPPVLSVVHAVRCPLPPLPAGVLSLHISELAAPPLLPGALVNLTLDRLPARSVPARLPSSLSSLRVSRCELVSVPSNWTSRRQLRRLRLSGNLLSSSPTRSARLPALLQLDLSFNKLVSLLPGDLPLPSLTDLRLDNNLLETLSGEVLAECPNLQQLRVANNRLTVLDVGGMPRGLRLVYARDNLFTELTDRELAGWPGLVLDYGRSPGTALRGELRLTGARGDWTELRLTGAPLHCGAALLDWTERVGPALSRVTAVCSSPPAIVGRALRDAPRDLYRDDVPSGCPAGCACLLRPSGPSLSVTCNVSRAGPELATYRAPPAAVAATFRLVLEGDLPPAVGLPEGVARLELRGTRLAGLPSLPAGLRELDVRRARAARAAEPAAGLAGLRVLLMCDCDMLRLVGGAGEMRCEGDEDAVEARERCSRREVEEDADRAALLSGELAAAVLVTSLLVAAVCWVVHYYRRPVATTSGDLQYDAFVSFAHEDRAWVCRTLVPRLEESGARLCLHSRDWLPGEFVPAQIDRSVRSARVTLLVASPHFARSPWAGAELTAALQGGRGALLLLLPDAPLPDLLRAHPLLARRTHLHSEDPHFWHKLQRVVLPPRPARTATPAALARWLRCSAWIPVTAEDDSYRKKLHAVT